MAYTRIHAIKSTVANQAYHLIQSFAKGEVSYEEAHRIGIELADKLLEVRFSELQKQIEEKTAEAKSARTELVELEHKMKKVAELLRYAKQYHDNKPFQEKYKKSRDPDRYLRMHETELILFDGAERMLRQMGLDPKSVNPSEIRADYESMQARKIALEKTYNSAEKEAKSLQQKLDNVEQYIGHEQSVILEQPTNTHSNLSNESRS